MPEFAHRREELKRPLVERAYLQRRPVTESGNRAREGHPRSIQQASVATQLQTMLSQLLADFIEAGDAEVLALQQVVARLAQ